MNIEKAVERIGWRLKQKHWKSNSNDIQAYNIIVDYVENLQKKIYKNHELFAKLYIHIYGQYLMKYHATPYDKIPKQILTKEISKSTHQQMQEFHKLVNEIIQIKQVEQATNDGDFSKVKSEPLEYDFVEENMVKQINEIIFKYPQWKN